MITTIQIHEEVKHELDKMRNQKETYEEAILRLMNDVKEAQRKRDEIMIEGYKEMADDIKAMAKEWEAVDLENWPKYDHDFNHPKKRHRAR